jgi:hypothetical protein
MIYITWCYCGIIKGGFLLPAWKSNLKSDPIDWLLEPNNPSMRYYTLLEILDKPETDPEVQAAKEQIMEIGIVSKILSKQQSDGYWDDPTKFYRAKYKGTVWQLIILAELGADGKDDRVKKACEFVLTKSQDKDSGGFSYDEGKKIPGGLPGTVIPCLTGNMVYSLIRFGYLEDPRIKHGIDWLTTYQTFDDGVKSWEKGWKYERLKMCFSKHSCFMGAAKTLKALTEIPEENRSKQVKDTINEAMEFFLIHHIHKKSHDLKKIAKPGWIRFGFPLMYQTDVLELMDLLTKEGVKDSRMEDGMAAIMKRQDDNGRWNLLSTFNGRFQTNIEQKGKPSKWITLNALKVIKRFYI